MYRQSYANVSNISAIACNSIEGNVSSTAEEFHTLYTCSAGFIVFGTVRITSIDEVKVYIGIGDKNADTNTLIIEHQGSSETKIYEKIVLGGDAFGGVIQKLSFNVKHKGAGLPLHYYNVSFNGVTDNASYSV